MIKSDNPIREASEDRLHRREPAKRFVNQVLSLDDSEGLVVGVLGPWGTGKSSFLNLTREQFKSAGADVLSFNPWMFSGADQLVSSFFAELSAQLKVRAGLAEIGTAIGEYGEALDGLGWLPLLGPWIERGRGLSKLVGAASKRKTGSIDERRARLIDRLKHADSPMVVILDDIDRLSTQEIRDVFKLVRLTASFPKIIYLVAFDRRRVELALTEGEVGGREYLEKILQVVVDLPSIRPETLRLETLTLLVEATEGVDWLNSEDEAAWLDVYSDVVAPLIRHMRDVRRYSLALSGAVLPFRGRIALSDVMALEAVRTFMPDVFALLPAAASALTSTTSSALGMHSDEGKAEIDALLKAAEDRREVVEAMIRRLFPAGMRHLSNTSYGSEWALTWRKQRRVAHIDHLRFYLEHIEGDALSAFDHAETAASLMHDEREFESYMENLPPTMRLEVIAGLRDASDSFSQQQIEPTVPYLLNTLRTLPAERPGIFSTPSSFFVEMVVQKLLQTVDDPADLRQIVAKLLPRVNWHGGRYLLLVIVSRTPRDGESLLSPTAAAPLQEDWLRQVRAADPTQLAQEPHILRTTWAARQSPQGEVEWDVPDSDPLTLALFRDAVVEGTVETSASRRTRTTRRLRADNLLRLFDTQSVLEGRVESVRSVLAEQDPELLEMLDRYIAGDADDDDGF